MEFHVAIDAVSLLINIGLIYLAVRLLSIFRGGKLGKPWVYISCGVFALEISTFLFALERVLNFHEAFIHIVGASIMMCGGLLMLIGLYH